MYVNIPLDGSQEINFEWFLLYCWWKKFHNQPPKGCTQLKTTWNFWHINWCKISEPSTVGIQLALTRKSDHLPFIPSSIPFGHLHLLPMHFALDMFAPDKAEFFWGPSCTQYFSHHQGWQLKFWDDQGIPIIFYIQKFSLITWAGKPPPCKSVCVILQNTMSLWGETSMRWSSQYSNTYIVQTCWLHPGFLISGTSKNKCSYLAKKNEAPEGPLTTLVIRTIGNVHFGCLLFGPKPYRRETGLTCLLNSKQSISCPMFHHFVQNTMSLFQSLCIPLLKPTPPKTNNP